MRPLSWNASTPPMKVKSSDCRCAEYALNVVLMPPMYRKTSSGARRRAAVWNGFVPSVSHGFRAPDSRLKKVGVPEKMSPGETIGLLSLPDTPRSVYECVKLLLTWMLKREPIG